MGQRHGKAAYIKVATPFVNASEKDVNKLWEAFNDVAEGFGLNQDETCEITRSLMATLEIHAKADMDQLTAPLFTAMDTDENGLIDALEFLGTMAVMSAMTIAQKLTFVYNCYDFNESGQISIDELTLALRSTLTGLCKLTSGVFCPTEMVLEDLALHAFHKSQKHGVDDFITLPEFLRFADTTPEMTSWIDYFDCPHELLGDQKDQHDDSDLELEEEQLSAAAVHPIDEEAATKRDPSFPFDAKKPAFLQDAPVTVQPWQAVVANMAPSAPPTINPNAPAASLELDWIYGMNSDLRSVVQYVTPHEIVFPAGTVAVLYDTIEHKQRFACHHADFVTCLAIHPLNRHVIASGERGLLSPKIVVWSTQSLTTTLSVVRGFHRVGISHVAWMPHGRTLISVGQDPFHCVAVYQWEAASTSSSASSSCIEWSKPATLVFADRCGTEPVHACVVASATQFVTSGRRHLFFWSRESDARYTSGHALYYKRRGVLGRKTKVQTLLSLAAMTSDPHTVLAGSARGQILVFEGRNCIRIVHAHASSVTVLQAFPGGILSGGRDGKVRLWSKRMEPGAQFDLEALGSVSSRVRSLVASPDGGAKLLIATSGAEVFEIAASDGSNLHFGAMLCGHFAFQLHGLATHPTKREFATSGDDRSVRVWDMVTHRQVRMVRFDAPSRACAYSPDGSLLAIGQGAEDEDGAPIKKRLGRLVNVNKQGAFAVLSEATLALKYEAKDSKKWIRTIGFSGDGLMCAVGSSDAFIYSYNTDDWASRGKCKARDTSVVLSHVDFSSTGEYIMANAVNKREMVFFETSSGVEITRIATLKDVDWLTTTCPFGWAIQGAWASQQSQYCEISAVARASSGAGPPLLAVGDAEGGLRLFRFPCVSPLAVAHTATRAASSRLSRVAFSSDSAFVVAAAQDERCVFQWRVEYEEQDFAATLHRDDGVTPAGPTAGGVAEFEYHATSDDEVERSHGDARSLFDEAAAAGDFAVELLGGMEGPGASDETVAATPVKPWVASAIAPTDVPFDDKDPERSTVPHESLELEWVYGYRCHDARNNVFSSRAKSWLVYPAARVVVVLDTKLWLQRHFKQHTDEVTAVAVFLGTKKKKGGSASRPPTTEESTRVDDTTSSTTWLGSAEVVASGQMGNVPVIHVWKLDTLEVVASLRGLHRRGIAELRFNGTGNLLVSVGLDSHHTLAVYDWQSGVVLAHAATRAGPGRVMGVAFQQQTEPAVGLMLCTVGVQQLTFWRLSSTHQLLKKDALLGKKGLLQTFLSVVYCGKDAVVGTTSGDLYRFKGIELASIVPAHQRSVAALVCLPQSPFQLASGGHDGLVKLWSADLECLGEFGEFNPPKHAVRSVWWDFDKNLLVVGTRGAAIHLLSSLDGSAVTPKTPDGSLVTAMDAHYRHELHGLSVCASKDRFCTTGDDATLRVWDMARHLEILSKALDTASRACAYSWDGDVIAVGLGGGHAAKRHKKDGSLLVFEDRGASVELVYETRDTKQSVSALAFSPDGASLVVGSLDNSVYVYDVPNNYAKRAVFAKHKSWITGLDVSSDSQYVRSTCGGCELLFSDITTGSHVASATALRNQTWATCATVFNWSNQGAWPVASRSSITASATTGSATDAMLAVGTSHGAVHLLKFPSVTKGAGFKSFAGHHGAVAKLAFSGRGAQCISIGASDRCVLQWRKTRASEEAPSSTGVIKDLDADDAIVLEGLFIPEAFQNLPTVDVKPYVSAIMPPTVELPEPTAREGDAATVAFELEHVFGVRLHDVRNNAAYAKTKHVLFHTGRLGVQYDRRTHTQRFYRGHARPILSLAVGGDFVATGEICSEHLQRERPRIHIWEPASCACVCVLSAFHTKAVAYVAFDATRRLLASVGQDGFHALAVYSSPSGLWFDGALLASAKTTRRQVYFVAFIEDPSSPFQLATGGHDHVTFWRLDAPGLVATRGVFGAKGQPQPQLCGGSMASLLVTGCLTGHLYVWESGVVTRAVPAHDEAVYAIHATSHGCVTGGRDGRIKIWSATVTPIAEFNLLDATPAVQHPSVRSVHWDVAEDRVLIGTRGGELLELSRLTNSTSLVTESHFDPSQLVALSAHPQRPELVATAGEDHTVRVWDLETREVLVKLTLDGPLRSLAYAPDGKTLVVGFGSEGHAAKDGAFVVLDAVTLEIRHEGRDAKQSILAMAFSPDLTLLALGGADHCVYVYSTLDAYALRFKCPKASGRVLHLDFAADSSALRLNSDAYELLYISTLDGAAIAAPSSMKDTQWASHACVFAWTTQGLWDAARDGEYVHAVAKAHARPLLASATNTGQVRVYNYPCLSRNAEQHVLTGHALHVSGVAFTCDDARLVSIGAHDKSLLVWKLVPAE